VTPKDFLQTAALRLQQAGVEDSMREAQLLVGAALGLDGAQLLSGTKDLSLDEEKKIEDWLRRREKREPLARLQGARGFWNAEFILNEATLEPRPDSETLIETALDLCKMPPARILDIGTGTGCLLLSLLQEFPESRGVGTDKSEKALEAARANAKTLKLENRAQFICTNWAEGASGAFDLVVSNPPYIASQDIPGLQPEVRDYDPRLSLDGGGDGLFAYRTLAASLRALMNQKALALFEIGEGQEEDVIRIFEGAGWKVAASRRDLADIPRVLAFTP
jgi:release factor glutamine methyltransferase